VVLGIHLHNGKPVNGYLAWVLGFGNSDTITSRLMTSMVETNVL